MPGGRLGDQLIAYMHAKWVSYLYDIPLLYKPFHYSNDLVLDDKEELYRRLLLFERDLKVEDLKIVARKHTPTSFLSLPISQKAATSSN